MRRYKLVEMRTGDGSTIWRLKVKCGPFWMWSRITFFRTIADIKMCGPDNIREFSNKDDAVKYAARSVCDDLRRKRKRISETEISYESLMEGLG